MFNILILDVVIIFYFIHLKSLRLLMPALPACCMVEPAKIS